MPLKVWVATKGNREVRCSHCMCMAGLGEACSHVAAVLFAAKFKLILSLDANSAQLLYCIHGYHQPFEV